MTTMNENKSECIDAVVRMLERTSAWRRSIAPNFNDPRNVRACQILDKLAVDATGMTDSQFQSLKAISLGTVCNGGMDSVWQRVKLAFTIARRILGRSSEHSCMSCRFRRERPHKWLL
jgi:hypothetical protein